MKKLFDAINKGDLATVKSIIENDKSLIECREKGWRKRDQDETPLRVAIKNCHYDIVRYLISVGCNVNDYTPRDGWYISHQAVYTAVMHTIPGYKRYVGTYRDSFNILKLLVENNMDINIEDENGVNCLFEGLNYSHVMMHSTLNMFESDLVDKLLWDPSFDVNIAYRGFIEIFRLLLDNGINTDIPRYWKTEAANWKGFEAKIGWANNILALCKDNEGYSNEKDS